MSMHILSRQPDLNNLVAKKSVLKGTFINIVCLKILQVKLTFQLIFIFYILSFMFILQCK